MSVPLKRLTIRGFKSIESLEDFELHDGVNVLIGANGAGKSNFVDFFRMLRALADEAFQVFVNTQGGDGLFFMGPQRTRMIEANLEFGNNKYRFSLSPSARGILIEQESTFFTDGGRWNVIGQGKPESALKSLKDQQSPRGPWPGVEHYAYQALSNCTVYHFHDTSIYAPMRRPGSIRDYERLRYNAENIAPYLYRLRDHHRGTYDSVRDVVRLVAPFFDDFVFRPEDKNGNSVVPLEWHQKGSDFPFQASHLSDGTIRFICLATALLQPTAPATLVIDEPELGLHPFAVATLADLIKSASTRMQVLISTQSPTLLDYFGPEDVVVVNREGGRSILTRLDASSLAEWLREYTVGELWQKDVLRGGPAHE
jgi:predicted ATPase